MKADSETQTLFYFIDAEKSSEIKRVWGVSAVSFGNDLNTLPDLYTTTSGSLHVSDAQC